MTFRTARFVALATLALALAAPAFAADTTPAAPAPTTAPASPNSEMMAQRLMMRQQMQTLHEEGMAIETATDALLDKCIAPEAAQVESCKKEKADLVARRAKHKTDIAAFRDKMQAEHDSMMKNRGPGKGPGAMAQ